MFTTLKSFLARFSDAALGTVKTSFASALVYTKIVRRHSITALYRFFKIEIPKRDLGEMEDLVENGRLADV
jgi:hypothetical protein